MSAPIVYVIDEFYSNPDEVRNIGLRMDYPSDIATKFAGRKQNGVYRPDWLDEKISNIVGETVTSMYDDSGYFQVALHHDKPPVDITIDPFTLPVISENPYLMGALFLSQPEDTMILNRHRSGLKLWRHKKLGWERLPLTEEECNDSGISDHQSVFSQLIKEGNDHSNWIETMDVKMVYNRLVLFRPFMFYSNGDGGFGKNILNSKMVQYFYWKKENG